MAKIVPIRVVLLLEGFWQVCDQTTIRPCGPKLCEAVCPSYMNCSAKYFDEIQLSCQLTVKRSTINLKPYGNGLESAVMLTQGVHQIPENCAKEPIYVNQGAVRKRKFSRPGFPVVIEYNCDQTGEQKYKYFSGPWEALCDDLGHWTLPAMNCLPTSCYTKVLDSSENISTLYAGATRQEKTGRECQAWTVDKPHDVTLEYNVHGACSGCGSLEDAGNKCRVIGHVTKPWCYTVDPNLRWEYCDVQECKTEKRCARPPIIHYAPAVRTELIDQKVQVTYRCHKDLQYWGGGNVSTCDMETGVWQWPYLLCASETCFHYDRDQWRAAVYLGSVSTTKSGRKCQRWDSQTPHRHDITASQIPGARTLSELGNVCRDPINAMMPWCYTTDPYLKWEFCNVRECTRQP